VDQTTTQHTLCVQTTRWRLCASRLHSIFWGRWIRLLVIKRNSAGSIEWNQSFGGTGENVGLLRCYLRREMADSALAGSTSSFSSAGKNDFWLVKTDEAGKMQWKPNVRRSRRRSGKVDNPNKRRRIADIRLQTLPLRPVPTTHGSSKRQRRHSEWNQTYGGPRPDGIILHSP